LLIVVSLSAATTTTARPVSQDGKIVADLGFTASTNGFGFENYGNDNRAQNLTQAEMRRLFGDKVCAELDGDKCILTPPAEEWMDTINKAMDGGHCEGMAALSLMLYTKTREPGDFGSTKVFDLKLDDNAKLQREIALWWATQGTSPTNTRELKDKTPVEIVDILIGAMKDGAKSKETYTMGIYKPDYTDGHAITPYAVKMISDDVYHVMVYDNNFPGQERFVEVNRKANTWTYSASTNPDVPESLYEGDAETKTLTLTPTTPRLKQQECDFCADSGSAKVPGLARAAAKHNAIYLESLDDENLIDLLIVDSSGKRLGRVGSKIVNEIPGADFRPVKSGDLWKDDEEPVYFVPVGVSFTITIDGSRLKKEQSANVLLIGPGYDIGVENITLEPGKKDTLVLAPDGTKLAYTPSGSESPDIIVGLEHTAADYAFEIKGFDLDAGGTINVSLEFAKGTLSVSTANSKATATYGLVVERIDDKGEAIFEHDDIELDPGETIYINFGKWDGKGELSIDIDEQSDGKIDKSETQTNNHK
jgi:hypothetical protein